MRPELFRIPLPFRWGAIDSIPVYAYGFFVMAGFLCALWIATRRARAMGIDPDLLVDLGLWVMVFGVAGARVYYVILFRADFDWGIVRAIPRAPFTPEGALGAIAGAAVAMAMLRRKARALLRPGSIGILVLAVFLGAIVVHGFVRRASYDFGLLRIDRGGLVIYGGLLGGVLAYAVFLKRRGASLLHVGDCIAPSVPIGQAFGRLGCFLNGCCFGSVCDGPVGVRFGRGTEAMPNPVFQHHAAAGWIEPSALLSLPVHPTQLYAAGADFLLFLLLVWFGPRRHARGETFALYAVAYPVVRFGLEAFRDDSERFAFGLTVAQMLSVAAFLGGVAFFAALRVRADGAAGAAALSRAAS